MRLIDGKSVLDYLNWLVSNTDDEKEKSAFRKVIFNICYEPTVDAKPVIHGRWVTGMYGLKECSECKERTMLSYHTAKPILYQFCPYCGAIMDKEEQ